MLDGPGATKSHRQQRPRHQRPVLLGIEAHHLVESDGQGEALFMGASDVGDFLGNMAWRFNNVTVPNGATAGAGCKLILDIITIYGGGGDVRGSKLVVNTSW